MQKEKVILYRTETCPKCNNVMKPKLQAFGIEFEECLDAEVMRSLGISKVPVLSVDGVLMDFVSANKWINSKLNPQDDQVINPLA